MATTECKHCDATDTENFGQCISCGEQMTEPTPQIEKLPCECEIKGGCRCNSMSVQPCGWCDAWDYHGDPMDCDKARYWCNGCDDYCEESGCTWCD